MRHSWEEVFGFWGKRVRCRRCGQEWPRSDARRGVGPCPGEVTYKYKVIPCGDKIGKGESMRVTKELEPQICSECGKEFEGLEGELCIECEWKRVESLKKRS